MKTFLKIVFGIYTLITVLGLGWVLFLFVAATAFPDKGSIEWWWLIVAPFTLIVLYIAFCLVLLIGYYIYARNRSILK